MLIKQAKLPSCNNVPTTFANMLLRMGQVQGQGYVGQALGAADLLAVSYFHAMKYQPENPEWEGRDRFIFLLDTMQLHSMQP